MAYQFRGHNIPNVPWEPFRTGLIDKCNSISSRKEQGNATGSFGQLKSTGFVSVLLQIWLAIGEESDILPKFMDTLVKGKRVKCDRLHAKAHNACMSILEVYFILKKVDHTMSELQKLKKQLQSMSIHVKFLWELKQILVDCPKLCMGIRNIDKILHYVEQLIELGNKYVWDTETTETSHKGETKDVYDVTSKRTDSYEVEMIKKNMNSHYLDFQTILMGIRAHGECYIRKEKSEYMQFSVLNNLSYYKFMRGPDKVLGFRSSCTVHRWLDLEDVMNTNIVLSDMINSYRLACPDSDLTVDNIATMALTMTRIFGVVMDGDSDSDSDTDFDRHIKQDNVYYIYPGVKYVPNEESLMENGHILRY